MLRGETSSSVSHPQGLRAQRKCFSQLEELLPLMTPVPLRCTEKLTAITLQASKSKESITGNSTQQITDLDMVKREFSMELLLLCILRGTKSNTQRPSLFRRLLRTKRLLHQIFSESLRTWAKVKLTEELTSFTVSKMFKLVTHGTLQDAFMESQLRKRCSQTTISERARNQTAGMLSERRRISIDHLGYQPSGKISHTKASGLLPTTK